MTEYQPSPLATVATEFVDGHPTLVFTRELRHAPQRVWAALTKADQVGRWSPFTAEQDLDQLGPSTIQMIDGDDAMPMTVEVVRCEPPTDLEYRWGDDLLRWHLDPIAGGTRLTLHHVTRGPEWVPMVAAGWHLCLDVAEHLLDGDPIPPIRGQEAREFGWEELRAEYEKRLS